MTATYTIEGIDCFVMKERRREGVGYWGRE